MTIFNYNTHRALFAPSGDPEANERIWWGDIEATMLRHLFGTDHVAIQLADPVDTSVLHYKPHGTNGGNGTFRLFFGGEWQTATPALVFEWLRIKAGYDGDGVGGGVSNGDKGDITVSDEAWEINPNAVGNAELANMNAYTYKMRNANDAGDPGDVNAVSLTADAAPASTRIVITHDPATGQPKKSTLAQLPSNVTRALMELALAGTASLGGNLEVGDAYDPGAYKLVVFDGTNIRLLAVSPSIGSA